MKLFRIFILAASCQSLVGATYDSYSQAGGALMKPLSEQLQDLSQRAKKIENSAVATREKNQAELERRRNQLESDMKTTGQKIETSVAQAKEKARSGWADLKNRIDERLAEARTKIEERKAERDVNRAERRAQAAEDDAADAIAIAVYVLDQAEYAVVDAALARAAADDIRAAA
jgi:hypothetical protein